jgi:hypothetical protein
MRDEYSDVAEFVLVYVKEAHPEDEWQMEVNEREKVVFRQPTTFEARMEIAQKFVEVMDVKTTCLVDDIANTAGICYAAWPERLYVIDTTGRIAYKGGMGPFDFRPSEVAAFLEGRYLAGSR